MSDKFYIEAENGVDGQSFWADEPYDSVDEAKRGYDAHRILMAPYGVEPKASLYRCHDNVLTEIARVDTDGSWYDMTAGDS